MYNDINEHYNFLLKNNFLILKEPLSYENYPKKVLNTSLDWKNISETYDKEKIVVVDNFLNPEFADRLQRYMLYLNVREDIYKDYAAVNFIRKSDNLWFPLLSNIVEECKENLDFLKNLDFKRAWAFIYTNESNGVPIHADPAAINFNLWVTADSSIIDIKEKNGLDVWKLYPPSDWTWEKYNGDRNAILETVNKNSSKKISVSYKFNRVTIFDSKFFHKTQPVITKLGYENRRINYTFLFGKD
jgi:hypothetical protein